MTQVSQTARLHCWWRPLPREVSEHHSPCLQATINLKSQRLSIGQASVTYELFQHLPDEQTTSCLGNPKVP